MIDRTSTEALTERLVHEIEHGLCGTDVLPGIIGEIGSNKEYVSAQEERVFGAAGQAAVRSNLAVTTHSAASPLDSSTSPCCDRVASIRIVWQSGMPIVTRSLSTIARC